jgi:hypothetical protein
MKKLNYPPDITTTNTEGVTKNALETSQYEEIPLSEEELKARAQKASAEGAKVVQLRQEAVEGAAEQTTAEKENDGTVFQLHNKDKKVFSLVSNAKTALTKAMAFIGLFAATQGNAQNNTKVTEKNLQAKEIQATGEQRIVSKGGGTERERFTPTGAVSYEKGLRPYLKANTIEGGITPTGKSNSFENNKYGLTMEDLYEIGARFRISTANNKSFQRGIYKKVMEIDPTVIDAMWEEYGETAAGEYDDGDLGGRTLFLSNFLKQIPPPQIQPEPIPDSIPGTDIDTLPSLEKPKPTLETADNIKVFFDLSSSMNDDKKQMADEIKSIDQIKPFQIIGFAETAESIFTANSSDEAAEKLLKLPESQSGKELAAKVTIKILSEKNEFSFNPTENNFVVWNTDEALQLEAAEIDQLEKLAQEQNINFDIRIKTKDGLKHLEIKDIRSIFEKNYKQTMEKSIAGITKKIQELTNEIQSPNISKEEKETKEGILKNYERNLEKTKMLSITGLEQI